MLGGAHRSYQYEENIFVFTRNSHTGIKYLHAKICMRKESNL